MTQKKARQCDWRLVEGDDFDMKKDIKTSRLIPSFNVLPMETSVIQDSKAIPRYVASKVAGSLNENGQVIVTLTKVMPENV